MDADLACHAAEEATNGMPTTLGPGGCAVCKNNVISNINAQFHSGCESGKPVCILTNQVGTCTQCKATTEYPGEIHDDDTCGGLTMVGIGGNNYHRSLGQCSQGGVCRCLPRPEFLNKDKKSGDVANPDRGCSSQNPSCQSVGCTCVYASCYAQEACTVVEQHLHEGTLSSRAATVFQQFENPSGTCQLGE